ncbi:MAG: gamma-glutamylcyclotransferase [Haliangiales bacterium]
MDSDLWIFGYGSLVWRPAFPYCERRFGYIRGYLRRFWQESTDHRGTPEAPGRVATLLPRADAICWGTAYQVEPDRADEVLARLDHREQQGYERVTVAVTLAPPASGSAASTTALGPGDGDGVEALMYVATADNPHYVGPETLVDIAAVVRASHGPSGSNREYVLRLSEALADMGADDPHVLELARLVAEGR